jgi:F-type H+-transporting ATPase subunit a
MPLNKYFGLKISILTFALFFISNLTFGQGAEKAVENALKKFDAGKTITEHITDSHEWHIMTVGGKAIAVPLPVILYSADRGLEMFSSSHLEEGEIYNGYRLEKNRIEAVDEKGIVDENRNANLWDFSITKNVASIFLSVILLLIIFISVANSYKKAPGATPKGLQSFVEPIIIFVRDDIAKASIGEKKYKKFMPYLLTIFFFIWINNLMGLIPILPGGANVTGNIAVTMTLALFTFIVILFNGNKHYWRHVLAMPGVPTWVLFLLTPIEILGVFLRPFVLMIRLFANMSAGHIIALSFFSLIFIFGEMSAGLGLGVSVVSVAFTVFMMFLELLVAFLQAYVFTLLSAIYFGAAVEEHHHAHDEHNEEIHEGLHHFGKPEQNLQGLI